MRKVTITQNEWPLNAATFISNIGDGMHTLAIGQILYERTGQVTSFGMVIALNYLIGILCQIFAGHLADRVVRSRLVKWSDFGRGVLALGLAVTVGLAWPAHFIIIISLLIKIGTQIYRPAYQAMISDAIASNRLSAFNAKNVACMQGGQLLGMALFGLLYIFGPAAVFVVDAMTFLTSAAVVHGLRLLNRPAERLLKPSVLSSWIEAYQYVRGQKGLLLHIALSASAFLIYPIVEISIVPINMLRFGGDSRWLSLMNAAFSFGCILSMIIIKRWKSEDHAYLWMIAQTFFLALLAASGDSRTFSIVGYLGMGIASTMASIQLLNRLMKRSPKSIQGRISALRYLFISLVIATVIPLLTAVFAFSLNSGIMASAGVMAAFALVATFASWRGSFLGDATVLGNS